MSTDAVIVVRPRDNRLNPVYFEFSYAISGAMYPWYQLYVIGPNGNSYFIGGVAIASFIVAILVIALILGIRHCVNNCNNKSNKVYDISH